ncbi:MAG TPA: hypothetical protein VGX03_26115 [Candidatus Binatia bacterium]|jgi:hypothetical protein|nr:hypothetical protein [Candidatus Binatia bacterium]
MTDRRTKRACVSCLQTFCYSPEPELIRVVPENLNTHTTATLSETFPLLEARRLLERLDFHYTPKHGSELTRVEMEVAVLAGQGQNQ